MSDALPIAPEELDPQAPLAGRVVDAAGMPMRDALVRAEGDRLLHIEAEFGERTTWEWKAGCNEVSTDGEGRFRFAQLYPGSFQLFASAVDAPELRAEVSTPSGREDVEIVLDRAALERVVFTGVVRDGSTGQPLTGFTVTPSFPTSKGSTLGHPRSFGPDAGGTFRLAGYEAKAYKLEVSAPGYGQWSEALREYREGEHRFDPILWPACTFRVRVVDEGGNRLRAELLFHDLDGRRLWLDDGTSRTNQITVDAMDEVVPGLPRHVVRVTASAPGYLATNMDLDLTVPPLEPIGLVLRRDAEGVRVSCHLALLTTRDPNVAASEEPEALREAYLDGRAVALAPPAEIEFLDADGELVASASFERNEEGQLVSRWTLGTDTLHAQIAGPELSFELPLRIVRARIRAEGCVTRLLELHLRDGEEARRVVALLVAD